MAVGTKRRVVYPLIGGVLIVLGIFWLMAWMVLPPLGEGESGQTLIENVEVVDEPEPPPEDQPPPPPEAAQLPDAPALARPDLPQMAGPVISAPDLASSVNVPVNLGASGFGLGAGAFKGFARGGGAGSGGYGTGKGFVGKPLLPLSTARPQMPEWACKQKIRGWVEAVFTVMPTGRVSEVRIIDANPRGVYEAAAIESISNWIYEESKGAREVKQRVEMDPAECVYNWQ